MLAVQSSFFVQKLDILGNSVVIRAGKSIAHMAFLPAEEILDQHEVRDRVGSAIAQTRVKLFNPRTEQWSQYFAGVKTLKPDD